MKRIRTFNWPALSFILLCIAASADPKSEKQDEGIKAEERVAVTLVDFDRATGEFEARIDNVSEEVVFVDIVQLKSPGVTVGKVGSLASIGSGSVPLHEALYARLGSRRRLGFENYRVFTGALPLPEDERADFVGVDPFVLRFVVRGWNKSADRFFSFSVDVAVKAPEE